MLSYIENYTSTLLNSRCKCKSNSWKKRQMMLKSLRIPTENFVFLQNKRHLTCYCWMEDKNGRSEKVR